MINDKNEVKLDEEDFDDTEETFIRWSNLLFLPFNPIFKSLVLVMVVIKTLLLNETDPNYSTYVYGTSIVISYIVNQQFDEIKPATLAELVIISVLMIAGNLLLTFVVFPKMVAEALLKLRRICTYYPQVHRLIEEAQRRNPNSTTYLEIKEFYAVIWKKRNGITWIPEVISELPRYLRIDIKQDLVWPVFYHSPTFRKASAPFKRALCEYIRIDYKLPGEKFFGGPHCQSHLHYVKSGIVQLISSDDGSTPLISVSSGTIFGDISFFIPFKRKVTAQCLTYCEVLYISRVDILNTIHKYPEDRRMIIQQAKDRIKHARTLYSCKQLVRGLDRTEDEGIAWIKKRWWEISEAVSKWKKLSCKKEPEKCKLPAEETAYHCAKYIGQLVLCSDVQLQMKSMFANVKFPWIFVPNSIFGRIWSNIVFATVFCVLVLYPPYITRHEKPKWFIFFQFWADLVYILDICVALLTSVGSVSCEYPNEKGELIRKTYNPGELLTSFGVFFKTASLRTLIAYTECEILYIKLNDFNNIVKSYPYEWDHIQNCVYEFSPAVDALVKDYVNKYRNMGFYDQRGLLITSMRKTIPHYLSRGFIFDVFGCMPFYQTVSLFVTTTIEENDGMLIDTMSKFAHLYLLTGYFDYVADMPNINFCLLMILKWQVVTLLVSLGSSHFFVSKCIWFEWGDGGELMGMSRQNYCWLPNYLPLDKKPTIHQLHMVYAESLNLAQSGFMRFNLGKFQINRKHLGVGFMLLVLGFMFWYVMCYSLTLLVLNYRGNTLFQHGVHQLRRFLKAERIEDTLIKRAVAHFRYWWLRTKGINIQSLMNERIGVIFRQDLSYYFFKKTVEASDTLLSGGESVERDLASAATQLYFLPGEIIVREMNLTPWVYIVHRGKIVVKQGGQDLAILTKGSLFGQLDGTSPRPVRISAESIDHADLLQIPFSEFQEIVGDKGRENIAKNSQSKYDYMLVRKMIFENPYNTVKYLLRGMKALKLPTELVVEGGECVYKTIRWRLLKKWQFYVDMLFLVVPLLSYHISYRNYGLFRLLRLYLLYDFHEQFCKGFQSTIAPILLKFVIVFLLLHSMTCGWVFVACRGGGINFKPDLL
ncbi:unnamed protein product, partial [Brenthis ino]